MASPVAFRDTLVGSKISAEADGVKGAAEVDFVRETGAALAVTVDQVFAGV